ncbi:MAG: hypothetical protein ABIT16_11825 [Croceibacterium sp.]
MIGPPGTEPKDFGSSFYKIAALAALAVAAIGFFGTYVRPMALGKFEGPQFAHVHGLLLTLWLLLIVTQTQLVRKRLSLHRKIGWAALLLAPLIALSTVMIGGEAARRDVAAMGPTGADNLIGAITTPLAFLLLVSGAILLRKAPQWHKRLLLLATVAILWPAWFRWRHFLPEFPRPDIWLGVVLADAPIVAAALRDRIRFGAVHPAYLTAGTALVAEQFAEVLLFGTPLWHRAALSLLETLP